MTGFCPLAMLSFTRYIPTPWIFACAVLSDVVQCGQSRGIQSWGWLQFVCPGKLLVFHSPDFSDVFLLSACTEVSLGLFFSILTCLYQWISKVLGRNALNLQTISHELFSLTSLIFVSWWRISLGISSLLSDGLTQMSIFSCFMWGNKE